MQKELLAEHLRRYHPGALCAATSRELERTFSIKGTELRQLVNQLRRAGIPIASNSSGYFYAATEQEVRATIGHLTRRISGIAAPITPRIIPSRRNGSRTKASVAPMYFIIPISSLRTEIPIDTVLLIRNMEITRRIPITAMEI